MSFQVRALGTDADADRVVAGLRTLQSRIQRRVCRKACLEGSQALNKRAKSLCPRRITFQTKSIDGKRVKKHRGEFTIAVSIPGLLSSIQTYDGGLLRKSLGYKVKTYTKTGTAVAVCGPRKGFREQIGVVSRGKDKGKPIFADPQKYAHLVENGTRRTSAKPWLRPASIVGAQVSRQVLHRELDSAIREATAA